MIVYWTRSLFVSQRLLWALFEVDRSLDRICYTFNLIYIISSFSCFFRVQRQSLVRICLVTVEMIPHLISLQLTSLTGFLSRSGSQHFHISCRENSPIYCNKQILISSYVLLLLWSSLQAHQDISSLKNIAGETGKKLSSLASTLMTDLQDRILWWCCVLFSKSPEVFVTIASFIISRGCKKWVH